MSPDELDEGRHKAAARRMEEAAKEAVTLARHLVGLTEIRVKPGVYFLMQQGQIVYVGQSECVLFRMAGHRVKDFDDARMLHVPDARERSRLEAAFIRMFKPPLNIALMPRIVSATLRA